MNENRYRAASARKSAALAALAIEAGLALLVVYGLAASRQPHHFGNTALVDFQTRVEPPLQTADQPPSRKQRLHAGGSRPAAALAEAPREAPLAAPPPAIPLSTAQLPIAGSTLAAHGTGLNSGAGIGSGFGNGTGDGNSATGTGGGSDPEWIGGKIRDKDYPKTVREAHISGTTVVSIAIGTDGRPTDCKLIETSGNRELDTTTCRLIRQRFRFRPARDADGKAVAGNVEYEQEWDAPPPPDGD